MTLPESIAVQKKPKMQALWQLAEYAEWNDWKPKWLWWRVLRWCDRLNGHNNFEYEGESK